MNHAWLLTGGNLGNREQNLAKARELINMNCGNIIKSSSLYETSLTARQLMRCILKAEKTMGRIRKEKYGPRIIDIDMLLFNNETHNYSFLKLPHPEMQNRRFALLPLAEIGPDVIHPVFNKTITELLNESEDKLEVKKIAD